MRILTLLMASFFLTSFAQDPLSDTIKKLDKLTLGIGVEGKIEKPSISITSSLNDALTGAFKQQVAGKLNDFKKKVNKGLNDKLASALKLGDSQSAELLDLEAILTDTDQALADLKNSDIVKQQQKKLEEKDIELPKPPTATEGVATEEKQ